MVIRKFNELIKDVIPKASHIEDGTKKLKHAFSRDEIRNKENKNFDIVIDHMNSQSIIILIC